MQREVKRSGGEFESIPEYIEFALRELLKEEEPPTPGKRRRRQRNASEP